MPNRQIDRRRPWHRFLVLAALSAAGIAAPVLDLYGKNPEVFVSNRTSGTQIVLFALLVALAFPLLGFVLIWPAERLNRRLADVVYMAFVVLGVLAVGLVTSRQLIPENTAGAIALVVAIGVAGVLIVRRNEGILAVVSVAIPVVLTMFLAFSPSARLIWGEPETDSIGADRIGDTASIVFIQLDEFPAASIMETDGTVNERLFPAFARLEEFGTWYRNAFSASIATSQSVPATLTGNLGGEGLSPSVVDYPENLFTLLGNEYEMHVIEWTAELCPEQLCEDYAGRAPARFVSLVRDAAVVYGHLALPDWPRRELPSIENAWKGFLGQDKPSPTTVGVSDYDVPPSGVRSRWIDWLQRLGDGFETDESPTLHYAHVEAPHVPWRVNPSGSHYERPERYTEVDGVQGSGFWGAGPDVSRLAFQRHLYQLGFLDQMLGTLFDRLDEAENWDDSLIVVTADHGASFVPGEHRRWPYSSNRDDLYRVPLFVKYPGQQGGEVRDEPAFAIDILPTIVDVLDIEIDWSFDGRSLRSIAGTDREHEIVHWCCSQEGADTELSSLFAQVERNHQRIPDQSSWTGVAAVGPFAGIVGQMVDELSPVFDGDLQWTIDYAEELDDVDRTSGMVQTLITGRLELPADLAGDQILVAVNGRVAGAGFLTRDAPDGGQIRALVAEEYIVEGPNELQILVPGFEGWLTGSAADVSLRFFAADGHELELEPEGGRRVQIDKVLPSDSGWTLTGWAADVKAKVTPDYIYVFVGETLVASGPPNVENGNVVGWFGSEDLLLSGFSFEISAEDVPAGIDLVTIIAEFDGHAVGDPAVLSN